MNKFYTRIRNYDGLFKEPRVWLQSYR